MKNSKVSAVCVLIVFIFLCAGFVQQEERKSAFVSLYKPSFICVESTLKEVVYINTAHIESIVITIPSWANSKANALIKLSSGDHILTRQDVFSILRQCNQEIQVEKE